MKPIEPNSYQPGQVDLIITTYNWTPALESVLETVARQSVLPNQTFIADDGSQPETSNLIERWSNQIKLIHVWQKDKGFRAAKARNLAVSRSNADYIIFIDGDCLLPDTFIKNHLELAYRKKIVAGSRFMNSPEQTKAILNDIRKFYASTQMYKFKKFNLGMLRDFRSKAWRTARTCNLGLHRTDFLAVEGFDENYQGWGKEDSDLIVRLLNNGISIRSGRFSVCVGHLNHSDSERIHLAENEKRFARCQISGSTHPQSSVLREP